MKRLVAALALVPALVCSSVEAHAQPPPPTASASDVARARALFDAGGRAYDDAKFDVALRAFQQAYAIAPREGLLFSTAQCHRRLYTTTGSATHHAEAVRLYREYIAKADKGARKADAVRALEELEARPPAGGSGTAPVPAPAPGPNAAAEATLLYVYSSTPGVMVSLDGGPPKAPDTFAVTPTKHKLKFSAPGFRDHEVEVQAIPGELVPVTKDLEEKPAKLTIDTSDGAEISVDGRFIGEAPLARPLELPSGSHFVAVQKVGRKTRSETISLERDKTKAVDFDLDTTTQRDVSFGILGAAGAALVGSGVLVGFAITRHNEAREIYEELQASGIVQVQLDAYDQARVERDRFAIASAAVGAGAVALGILGIGLILVDPPERAVPSGSDQPDEKKDDAPQGGLEVVGFAPYVGPDQGGANLMLRF